MKRGQLALVLLVLAACGREPFHGVVIAKSYETAHTFTSVSTVCNGKTCTPVISVSTTPECFAIVVKQDTLGLPGPASSARWTRLPGPLTWSASS